MGDRKAHLRRPLCCLVTWKKQTSESCVCSLVRRQAACKWAAKHEQISEGNIPRGHQLFSASIGLCGRSIWCAARRVFGPNSHVGRPSCSMVNDESHDKRPQSTRAAEGQEVAQISLRFSYSSFASSTQRDTTLGRLYKPQAENNGRLQSGIANSCQRKFKFFFSRGAAKPSPVDLVFSPNSPTSTRRRQLICKLLSAGTREAA